MHVLKRWTYLINGLTMDAASSGCLLELLIVSYCFSQTPLPPFSSTLCEPRSSLYKERKSIKSIKPNLSVGTEHPWHRFKHTCTHTHTHADSQTQKQEIHMCTVLHTHTSPLTHKLFWLWCTFTPLLIPLTHSHLSHTHTHRQTHTHTHDMGKWQPHNKSLA